MKQNAVPRASSESRRRLAALVAIACTLAIAGLCLAGVAARRSAASAPPNFENGGLFSDTQVWTIHLTFTPEEWAAMEPTGGGGFGPGGRGGPGGGPDGPGGPGGFGPANQLAPAWLSQGDANRDGALTRDEFVALGEKWFAAWDRNDRGSLDAAKIRTGLATLLQPNGAAARGGAPGPGGGPGGPSFIGANGRNGMSAASGIDFREVRATLELDGAVIPQVNVRYKGNNTFQTARNSLKRSLKIDLNDGFAGRKLGGVAKLNLHNNINDVSAMNEPLSYQLFREAGVPAPRTGYARVYVTVPGLHARRYFGLYSIVENPDNNFARERFGTKKGAIFKPVTRQLFEDLGSDWAAYRQAYDAKTPVSEEETRRVIAFAQLVSHADDAEFAAHVGDFLDVDEFARFMAVTVWLSNMDSILQMGQNFIVYLQPKTRLFQFIPWDLDHSFGQFGMGGGQSDTLSIEHPWTGQNRFLERVFAVPLFKRAYLGWMKKFSGSLFRPERFYAQVDELAPLLRPAIEEESAEMRVRFDRTIAGETVGAEAPMGRGRGGPGGGPGGGKPIKPFVTARAASVIAQLAGKAAPVVANNRGDFGGPGRGGGPGGFDPANAIATAILTAADANRDGAATLAEFLAQWTRWFDAWDTDHTGRLTEAQLRAGLERDLLPRRGPPPPF